MAMTTAEKHGYLPAAHKPACGNCWAITEDKAATCPGLARCSTGGFAVATDGWCVAWLPNAAWIDAHPHVASQLGLSLGSQKFQTTPPGAQQQRTSR